MDLHSAVALLRFDFQPLAIAETKALHHLRRDKHVVGVALEKAFRVADKAEALAGDFAITLDFHELDRLGFARCSLLGAFAGLRLAGFARLTDFPLLSL